MKRIAILYFSGVGNTKAVAQLFQKCLDGSADTDIFSIERMPEDFSWEKYSAVVIGAPTYHSEPAEPMMSFVRSAAPRRNMPAFIFATCGMYPENCLRHFGRECAKRGIIPVAHASYRCSATDGILLAPWMKRWYENEKELPEKIKRAAEAYLRLLNNGAKQDMPGCKWYAPLNFPNKLMGRAVTLPIHLHREICIGCGKCAGRCPKAAIAMDKGHPVINKDKCINCCRCIHHCPVLALSLSRRKPVKKVWRSTI